MRSSSLESLEIGFAGGILGGGISNIVIASIEAADYSHAHPSLSLHEVMQATEPTLHISFENDIIANAFLIGFGVAIAAQVIRRNRRH